MHLEKAFCKGDPSRASFNIQTILDVAFSGDLILHLPLQFFQTVGAMATDDIVA